MWDLASDKATTTVRNCGACGQRFLCLNSQTALPAELGIQPRVDVGGFCRGCQGYLCEAHAILECRDVGARQFLILSCRACREPLRPDESERWTDLVADQETDLGTLSSPN